MAVLDRTMSIVVFLSDLAAAMPSCFYNQVTNFRTAFSRYFFPGSSPVAATCKWLSSPREFNDHAGVGLRMGAIRGNKLNVQRVGRALLKSLCPTAAP